MIIAGAESLWGGMLGALSFEVKTFLWWRWLIILAAALLLLRILLPRTKTTLPQVGREVLIVVPAYFAYSFVRRVTEGRASDAFQHAGKIMELERDIGIFWEH